MFPAVHRLFFPLASKLARKLYRGLKCFTVVFSTSNWTFTNNAFDLKLTIKL